MKNLSSKISMQPVLYVYLFFLCLPYNLEWFYISGSFGYIDLFLPIILIISFLQVSMKIDYIFLCLLFLATLSCISSINAVSVLGIDHVNIGYLFRSIYFVFLYLLFNNLNFNIDKVMRVLILSLLFSLILCIFIWTSSPRYFAFTKIPMLHVLDSPLGIMVNRNETGLSSSLLFTISFFGLIYNKYFSRILLTFVVLVSGFAVAFSFSKGAWLLTIIGAFLVLASLYRYKIIIMSILLILLSPLFSISSDLEFIDAVLTRFADSGESNSARLTYIIDSFSIGMNHIFLGIGPGNYGEYSSKANYMQTIDPHNAYLQTFAELGIVGFILVIILYFSALIQAYLKSKSNDSFILIYILILLLIADGFQSGLSLTMKILYVLLALIMSRKSEERETI